MRATPKRRELRRSQQQIRQHASRIFPGWTRPSTRLGLQAGSSEGGEALLNGAELDEDTGLDMRPKGCVRPTDQVGDYGDKRGVLSGQPDGLRASGVDDSDSVVGEVRDLDDPRTRTGTLASLIELIGKWCVDSGDSFLPSIHQSFRPDSGAPT